jgi:hypothetical protein
MITFIMYLRSLEALASHTVVASKRNAVQRTAIDCDSSKDTAVLFQKTAMVFKNMLLTVVFF